MAEIIQHPSAWRGAELLDREDWLYHFTAADAEEVHNALRYLSTIGKPLPESAADFPLPDFSARLFAIQDSLENGSGAAMIRGFPIATNTKSQAEQFFMGLAQHIGTPVSQSASGELVFHVRDAGHKMGDAQARGPNTRKRLGFHTDRCDVIAFLCLQPAKTGGENQIVSSMTIYNEILTRRPDLLGVLMEPFYYLRHNVDLGNAKTHCRQPVFSFHEGHFAANLLRVLIERAYADSNYPDMTDAQREALNFVDEVATEPEFQVRFTQQTGDILFLNNFVTFHRRTEFEDHDDPEYKRDLLRIWLSVPNSRPLDPLFADNYGDVRAGSIRGGMRAL